MTQSLIPRQHFVGLDEGVHLACGGEAPMLKSHLEVMRRFMDDKSGGEASREKQFSVMEAARQKCGQLFSVNPRDITFLSNSSEGINNVAYGLDWRAGDNVVVADVEFPSDVLPWTRLAERGVELRIVRHNNWRISVDDIADKIDANTRVVAISHVSMFTGQRMDLPELSRMVRDSNALLLLDATHAAGVVPVDARYADIMVSSCYKFMLATHGCAVFYWNRERLPDFAPPFLGWNSIAKSAGWKDPTAFELHESADRFLPGNPGFLNLYILDNALDCLLAVDAGEMERHVLDLGRELLDCVVQCGWELMTPEADRERAANVCFRVADVAALARVLESRNILIWGTYADFGRARISLHGYNDSEDIRRCADALREAAEQVSQR